MADQATPAPAAADKPVNIKLLIPTNDGTLAEVARLVAAAWSLETWFTMRCKTQADFAKLVGEFSTGLTDKRSAATSRTPQSQRLQE